MSSGASSPPSSGFFAPSEVVREIGARPNPVYVVRHPVAGVGGKPQLAIAERFEGVARAGDPAGEQCVREARRIATLASPNLPRVKEVLTRGDDLVVLTEFVEGEKLQEIWQSRTLPLEIALRVIVDVLAGVGALHNLRDAKQQPMKVAHGEVSPATIVLGLDGVARVLHSIARRAPSAAPEAGSLGYLAPEVLSDEPFDARADVFSAGVLLWEALSGKRLFLDRDAADIVRRIRGGKLPESGAPEKAAWAKGLVPVVAKALASAPDDRWPTAAVLAAEIRKAAGLKLAPASTAAAFARSAIGERVKARREALDGVAPSTRSPEPPAATTSPKPPVVATNGEAPPPRAETPSESVLVVPGIRAEVAEVVELESSLLMPAPESIPPPATSSAVGGFVLDPFAAAAAFAKTAPSFPQPSPVAAPPPLAVAVAPVVSIGVADPQAEEPRSVTGAPHFAAAIDLPPQAPPRLAPPTLPGLLEVTLPVSSAEPAVEPEDRGARRRKFLVLGGVAVLGATIFALAAVRIAGRDEGTRPATTRPSVANAQATPPPPPAPPPTPPPAVTASAPAPPTPAAVPVPTTPPQAQPPAQPVPTVAPRPTAAATQPTPAVATPPRVAPVATAPAPKPRPKPTFDPNSL